MCYRQKQQVKIEENKTETRKLMWLPHLMTNTLLNNKFFRFELRYTLGPCLHISSHIFYIHIYLEEGKLYSYYTLIQLKFKAEFTFRSISKLWTVKDAKSIVFFSCLHYYEMAVLWLVSGLCLTLSKGSQGDLQRVKVALFQDSPLCVNVWE